MTEIKEKFKKRWENFWVKFYHFDSIMKVLSVDFNKPWWLIIWKQKINFLIILFLEIITNSFSILLPLIIGYAISASNYTLFFWAVGIRMFSSFIIHYLYKVNSILQLQSVNAVYFSAHKFFLTTDPLSHSTRSSGTIVSKVERGASAYETLLDIVCFEFIPAIISFVAVIIAFFSFDWKFGLSAFLFISFVGTLNIFGSIFNNSVFIPTSILKADIFKSTAMENLQQTSYIRSVFNTDQQLNKLKSRGLNSMAYDGTMWQMSGFVFSISLTIYFASILVIGNLIFLAIENNGLDKTVAVSLLGTYLLGTGNILFLGDKIRRLNQTTSYIKDLFEFIQNYGKQSYPVLEEGASSNTTFVK